MTNKFNYFIGNWKMFGDLSSIRLIKKISINLNRFKKKKFKVVFCIPYTLINSYSKQLNQSNISIGAQNVHYLYEYGSYTGSINSKMIKNAGAEYVIIGHSENRINGDTDTIINKKIKSSLKNNIKIILCIGETNKQKINKQTNRILKKQIVLSLKGIRSIKNIIFAYEPVWAIGTGKVPNKYELSKNILYIKSQIQNKFKKTQNINILYGGSVNPRNIVELNSIDHLNGYLIGGASKSSKKFIDIMNKTYK